MKPARGSYAPIPTSRLSPPLSPRRGRPGTDVFRYTYIYSCRSPLRVDRTLRCTSWLPPPHSPQRCGPRSISIHSAGLAVYLYSDIPIYIFLSVSLRVYIYVYILKTSREDLKRPTLHGAHDTLYNKSMLSVFN